MLIVDLIIGNADRRGANYFVAKVDGKLTPIPVDNNCALLSGLTNTDVTNHCNFRKSFGKNRPIEWGKFDPATLGSIGIIIADAPDYRALLADEEVRERLPAIVDELVAALDNRFFAGLVDALPVEIVPEEMVVEPWQQGRDLKKLDADWQEAFADAWAFVPKKGLSKRADVFNARKKELKDVFAWRRDNVKATLLAYVAEQFGKASEEAPGRKSKPPTTPKTGRQSSMLS
jgi:hypothetical protein